MTEFTQWTSSKKFYAFCRRDAADLDGWVGSDRQFDIEIIDGTHLPMACFLPRQPVGGRKEPLKDEARQLSKLSWSLTHYNADGSPSAGIATIEVSADGVSGLLTTHDLPGSIVIAVSAEVSPTVDMTTRFKINVTPHPIA